MSFQSIGYAIITISTRGKKFSVKIKYKYGWACRKHGKKEWMKTQEDYPVAEKSGKEKLEDCSTSVASSHNRIRVVFQPFFTTTFLQQDSLAFSSIPCFRTFYMPIPTCT